MQEPGKKIALRMDDVGASTKRFERYSRNRYLNVGPLRDRRLFGCWGPYREMNPREWEEVFEILETHRAKLTVGVTAAWVEGDGTLTPFPEKFPSEVDALKVGIEKGVLEIANHGLTHCVVEGNRFKPRWWGSNRQYHREFWAWIPRATHVEHLCRAQQILEAAFGVRVTTFIPPGNVYTADTLAACESVGVNVLNCNDPKIFGKPESKVKVIGNEGVIAFHDREIVLQGTDWLRNQILSVSQQGFCFVRDL